MRRRFPAIFSLMLLGWLTITGCATLPENTDRMESHAVTASDDARLGKAWRHEKAIHPGQSGFLLLNNGLDAFVARVVLARAADQSIDAQYYLLHNDLTGKLFIHQLIQAADRGVRVRLLVDDMALTGNDMGALVLDSHPDIQVRIFNPFSRKTGRLSQLVTRYGSVTRRMHNKSFTVDNQATILGGRNIGNEYFDADPDIAFGDLDVLCIGPMVEKASASFDLYWNSELAYPASTLAGKRPTPMEIEEKNKQLNQFISELSDSPYMQALRNSSLADQLRRNTVRFHWGEADVVYDAPEKLLHDESKTEYHLAPRIAPYFEALTRELIIFSPYFVPGKEGVAFLTDLCKKGVRVRILTNSLSSTDVGLVHAGYAKYRKALLRGGVELYELNKKITRAEREKKQGKISASKASLHAKSFIFDRQRVFIGSLNLDPRSVVHNTEIGVVFNSPEIAVDISEWFDQHIETLAFRLELAPRASGGSRILWHGIVDGSPRTFTTDPYTGFLRRFSLRLLGLLPIESQL